MGKKQKKDQANPDAEQDTMEPANGSDTAADNGSGSPEPLSENIETVLRAEIEHLNKELTEATESYLRLAAELDNLRKRNATELEKARKFAIDSFAKSLLEVMESLDKACEIDQVEDATAILDGVELTRKQLLSVFERASIRKIVPNPGDPFDVSEQEAMTLVPTDDMRPNHIFEVFRPGYMIHDRLLRAAMVIVSAAVPSNQGASESEASSIGESAEEDA